MSRKRKKELSMGKIREIFRLALQCGISSREIGKVCGVSHSTVQDYLKRSKQTGLNHEKIKAMDDQLPQADSNLPAPQSLFSQRGRYPRTEVRGT